MACRGSPRIASLAAAALLASAVPAQQSQQSGAAPGINAAGQPYCTNAPGIAYRVCPQPPQPQASQTPRTNDDGGGSMLVPIVTIAAIGGLIAALTHEKSKDHAGEGARFDSESLLDQKGPQLAKTAHVGSFEVEGYVRGGWPLVFNVDAAPGASIYLKLSVDGVDPARLPGYELFRPRPTPPPARGRTRGAAPPQPPEIAANGWYARADLPRLPELDQPRRAWLQLFAVKDKMLTPLSVYAVGAGPKAVGSTALTIDRFGPSPLSRKGDPRAANYLVSFHNQALFPRLVARISQQRAIEQGGYRRKFVGGDIDLVQMRQPAWAPTISGTWPGPGVRLPGKGLYDMNVVMFTPHGDWVLGVSPTPVTIQ